MASEPTAAAGGAVGKLRFDPMAMLAFCGYNMADYFTHWLQVGTKTEAGKLPQIFFVNWFRRDEDGRFIWPGYGENSRVLKWVFERLNGTAEADKTAFGDRLRNELATALDPLESSLSQVNSSKIKFVQADDHSDKPKECFTCSGTGKVTIGFSEQSLEFHYDDCSQCAGTGRTC